MGFEYTAVVIQIPSLLRAVFVLMPCLALAGQDTVFLQLRWNHGILNAGIYLAKETGIFEEKGIYVRLLEGDFSRDPYRMVREGKAQFGIGGSKILDYTQNDAPFQAIVSIFQRSPYVLLHRPGLAPEALRENLALPSSVVLDPEVRLLLRTLGIDTAAVKHYSPSQDGWRNLLNDSLACYLAIKGGIGYDINAQGQLLTGTPMSELGVDCCGDVLFISSEVARENAGLAKRFGEAVMAGWKLALQKPDKAMLYAHKYAPNQPYMSDDEIESLFRWLLAADVAEVGYLSQQRWDNFQHQCVLANVLPKGKLQQFPIFRDSPSRQQASHWPIWFMGVLCVILAIVLSISIHIYLRLTKILGKRNAELETERNKMELALQASSDGIWDWADVSKDNLWWSLRTYELLGYDPIHFPTTYSNILAIVHAEDVTRFVSQLERSQTLDSVELEVRLLNHANLYRWFRIRGRYHREKEVIRFTAMMQDIHERKVAEVVLLQSEARFRSYFEQGLVGLAILDSKGGWIQANGFLTNLLGYDGMFSFPPGGLLSVIAERDQESWARLWDRVTMGMQEDVRQETYMIAKDGTLKPVIAAVRAVRVEGRYLHAVLVVLDIAAIRASEQERQDLLEELSLKNRSLESMLYAASHDLRAPLVNIQGFTRELQTSIDEYINDNYMWASHSDLQAKAKSWFADNVDICLDHIYRGAKRMDLLLEGLLRLTRLGRGVSEAKTIDMDKLVRLVLDELKGSLRQADAKVDVGVLPPCIGEESQIYLVLQNLISNAVKYRHPQRLLQIQISGVKEAARSVYLVQDNGIGIAASNLHAVFNPFVRLMELDNVPGDGLGLAIVSRIVDAHRGRVEVSSVHGEGSLFRIQLPCSEKNNR